MNASDNLLARLPDAQIWFVSQAVLKWEDEDLAESIAAIQEGLDDFEAGRFQSFEDFAREKRERFDGTIAS